MKAFLDQDFLLSTKTAQSLYHDFAAVMPICDYHCHLSPKEIYENEPPEDLAGLWFTNDHYKWRAMRAAGAPEALCTGQSPGYNKLLAFAKALEQAPGNPLYHWAHLELQRYFHINEPLNTLTAPSVWEQANHSIKQGDFRPQSLITRSRVTVLCTTDDPIDDLRYHGLLNKQTDFSTQVRPTFRPDRALSPDKADFGTYIRLLEKATGSPIRSAEETAQVLVKRIAYFHRAGCQVADHSFGVLPYRPDKTEAEAAFQKGLSGQAVTEGELAAYQTCLMLELARAYVQNNWAMELHMGALRSPNGRMLRLLGPDTGFDTMGDGQPAAPLAQFLDALECTGQLPKTVLFNLNPKDNPVLAVLAGSFQTQPGLAGKVQFGPAWWFLDTLEGMTAQLKQLAATGLLGTFIGMETDSRSFTSYPRHEYFRRVLCRLLGEWVEEGLFDPNEALLKTLVQKICYHNAMDYFDFLAEATLPSK